MISSPQIRAALALLGWSRVEFQEATEVPYKTIQKAAEGSGPPRSHASTVVKIQSALEEAGIEFLDATEDHGAGVRFKEPG